VSKNAAEEIVSEELDIENLSWALQQERPPYHVFCYREQYLLYEIRNGVLFWIDEGMYALLSGIERRSSPQEILAGIRGAGCPESSVLVQEIKALLRLGLFRSETLRSDEEKESLIASYLSHRPRKMMMLVQTSCNLACTYCYEVASGFHFTGKGRMDLKTAQLSIDDLVARSGDRNVLEITFFGGEPLLNFALVRDVVEYCSGLARTTGKLFTYSITTNATLLTDEIIDFLVRHRFASMLSIDGPPEASDRARKDLGGRGVGKKAVANARKLIAAQRSAGLRPAMVRATLSHENHDARAAEKYFAEQNFPRTMLGTAGGRAHAKGPADLTDSDIAELHGGLDQSIEEYVQWMNGTGPKPPGRSLDRSIKEIAAKVEAGPHNGRVGCGVGRNMLAYSENGTLYPCHRYAGEEAFQLGDVAGGLDMLKLAAFYREILDVYDEHCSKCWARAICGGQCAHYISGPDGHVHPPDVAGCNHLRSAFEKRLWLYSLIKRNNSAK